MLVDYFVTLNNRKNEPAVIERQFEETRSKYLKDLDKLRRKYASKLIQLASEYDSACLTESR